MRTETNFLKRRSWLKICEEILTIALEGAGTTRIVYGVNISFPRFKKYSAFLVERQLLTLEDMPKRSVYYRTTEEGKVFLKLMKKVRGFVEGPPAHPRILEPQGLSSPSPPQGRMR